MRDEIIKIYSVPEEKIQIVSPSSDTWIKDILRLYKTAAGGLKSK
jgi:hypothetical protein